MADVTVAADRRYTKLLVLPRSEQVEAGMDIAAGAFEARRGVGRAYLAVVRGTDPRPALFDADRHLVRLQETGRRLAAEAEGITYIDRRQLALPFHDGCLPGGGAA